MKRCLPAILPAYWHFSSLQLIPCVWKCVFALKFIELVLPLAGSFLLLWAQIVLKAESTICSISVISHLAFFAWLSSHSNEASLLLCHINCTCAVMCQKKANLKTVRFIHLNETVCQQHNWVQVRPKTPRGVIRDLAAVLLWHWISRLPKQYTSVYFFSRTSFSTGFSQLLIPCLLSRKWLFPSFL